MSTPPSEKIGTRPIMQGELFRPVPGAWLLLGLGAVNCTGTIGALSQDDPSRGPSASTENPGAGSRGTAGSSQGPAGIGGAGSSSMTGDPGSATDPGNPDPGSTSPGGTTMPPSFSCTSPDVPD